MDVTETKFIQFVRQVGLASAQESLERAQEILTVLFTYEGGNLTKASKHLRASKSEQAVLPFEAISGTLSSKEARQLDKDLSDTFAKGEGHLPLLTSFGAVNINCSAEVRKFVSENSGTHTIRQMATALTAVHPQTEYSKWYRLGYTMSAAGTPYRSLTRDSRGLLTLK